MRVQSAIEIYAPPEEIWPFLIEPEKILKWCITFKKFEYTGEKNGGLETKFYVEEKAGPTPTMKLNFVVTEWVENERVAFRLVSGSGVKSYEQGWTIKPTSYGSRFLFMEEVSLPFGIIGKFIGLFGQSSSRATVGKMLATLKSLIETPEKHLPPSPDEEESSEPENGAESPGEGEAAG